MTATKLIELLSCGLMAILAITFFHEAHRKRLAEKKWSKDNTVRQYDGR